MTNAVRLSDYQNVLLSTAAKRLSGSIILPSIGEPARRGNCKRSLKVLIDRNLTDEVDTTDEHEIWCDEDVPRLAAVITPAGRAAVSEPDRCNRPSKEMQLVELISRGGGATLAELAGVTGWLPHTTRAALSGLRKKGHLIYTERVDGVTRYRIGVPA